MIRRLIGFILSIIVAAILFILIILLFPSRKKSVDVVDMTYIFIDDDGIEYDVFEPVHGAARDWSFLFKKDNDEENGEDNIEEQSGGNEELQNNEWKKNNVLGNIDYVGELEISTGNPVHESETVSLPENVDDSYNLPEGAIEKPIFKDCETPRGITIKDGEAIFAYQQRKDVPEICNVQKRTCSNGVLDGSFTQPACNETVVYVNTNSPSQNITSESNNVVSYTKKQVVPHNDTTVKSELVQTPKYSKNELEEYDNNGKIKKGEAQPKTNWDNNNQEGLIKEYSSEEQKNIKHYNCQSPWGGIVQHGQFIKAYELPYGFTNASCRIELRLCVDGELQGSYTYKDCQYLDITYEEYNTRSLSSASNHEITDDDEAKTGFWERVKNLFK